MYNAAEKTVTSMQSLPSPLLGLGRLGHKRYGMRVEWADAGKVYLHTAGYLRPWTVFELYLWLDESSAPLYVLATATLVEYREDGYHILANLTGIEAQDSLRWITFYQSVCSMTRTTDAPQRDRQKDVPRIRRILMLGDSLTEQTQKQLRDLDVRIDVVQTLRQTLHAVSSGRYDAVLADRDHLASNDQALAKEILQHSQGTKTKLLLVCSRDVQREMETGLALGAHAVISRPRPESQLAELLYAKLHEAAPLADMQRDTIGVGQTQSGWQRIQRLFSAVSESMTMYLRGARVRISSDFDSETAARPHAA